MSDLTMTIKVESDYSDGHHSETVKTVTIRPVVSEGHLWEQLCDYTGDGHGIGADLGSCYTITVTACADRPELVGLSEEWID